MHNLNNPEEWPTNDQRARELLKIADDITWESHGRIDVSHLRRMITELLQNPNHKEPPF